MRALVARLFIAKIFPQVNTTQSAEKKNNMSFIEKVYLKFNGRSDKLELIHYLFFLQIDGENVSPLNILFSHLTFQ